MSLKNLFIAVAAPMLLIGLLGGTTAFAQPVASGVTVQGTTPNFLVSDDLSVSYTLTDATTAAVAWYQNASPVATLQLPMEGGATAAVTDYSGNANTLTSVGTVSWSATSGHDGNGALDFSTSYYINAGEVFPVSGSYTKAAWVRRDDNASASNNIMSSEDVTGGHVFYASQSQGFRVSAGHDGNFNAVQDPTPLAVDTWYHVAVTFDYTSGLMSLYKDGALVDSLTIPVAQRDVADATLLIGAFSNSSNWDGTLDDVRLYPTALPAEQINALYLSGETIDSEMTVLNDTWQAEVTPFSTTAAGSSVLSNVVTIQTDPPSLSDIPGETIAEGGSFATIDLTTYVTDPNHTPAEMTWSYSGDVNLSVSIVSGVATVTPIDAEWNGSETITFRATDPDGLYAEDPATFTVTAVNDAPIVTDIPDQTIDEGQTFTTINLDDYVSDVDHADADMTWTATGQTELTVSIDAGTRVATITIPDADWNGAETVTFRATDPGALFAEDAATFTVNAVNDAPVVSDIPDQPINEGETFTTISLDDYVDDVDNADADMTWTATGQTELTVSIDAGTRVATITIPDADWNGAETVTFRATDPGALFGEDAATFTVTAVNDAPAVSDIPDQTIDEGSTFATISLDDYVDDVDNLDSDMTWTATGQTELTVSIDAGTRVATITIPSTEWSGAETVTFRATDPGALFGEDAATFTVTAVNDAPVVTDIPDQTIDEGQTFTTINLDDYVSDIDNADADMTWTATGQTELTVSINAGTRVATITIPDVDWNGAETVTFRATDPGALFAEDAATFTVNAVNDAPVVTGIPNQTIAEGATFATIALDDYVTDVDNADADMTWTATGQTELNVSIDAGTRVATITTPSPTWNGAETITFRATDPGLLFGEDAATFTVTAVNDAPVVIDIPDQTIAEGATFTTISLDDYVSDADNVDAEMTWTATGQTELTVSIDAGTRVATITIPDVDWNGTETVTFRATDPGLLFDEDAATFTVTAVNDAPVVTDIPDQTIDEGATFTTISLDSYVTDVDNADADMTWTATGQTELTVSIDAGTRVATITIPSTEWSGAETVTFRATDPGALFAEDAATFTVTAVNDAPIVADIPDQTIAEGATFATIALDDYVSDVDNADADMTWTATGQTELTVSIDAGTRVATITIPDVDWNGAETVTFRATDPGALFGEDAATFTVTAVNDGPVVSDIPDQTIDEGSTFATISLDDFVDDVDNLDSDMTWTATGQTELTVSIDAGTRVATITIPDVDWNGAETVTFRATDPGALFAEDAAIFTVNAVNDAPVVSDIPNQSVSEGQPFATINLDDYVDDVDNTDAEMTWTATGQVELTVSIDAGTRVATITPPSPTWNGVEIVTFRATDPSNDFGEDVAAFAVGSVNDAPVVTDIPDQTVAEGATFTTIALDDYVSDVDNTDDEMTWTATGQTELTVSIDAGTRVATITIPNTDWFGAETITFRATDPGLAFGEDAATFTVTNINDAPVVSDIPNQSINEGETFATISLDDYVDDIDNTDAEMTWTATGQVDLTVSIDAGTRVATITTPSPTWNGAETITFRATDPGTLFAEDVATFTVGAVNDAPVVTDIPDQTIAEGATFTTISLDDFVSDVDNVDADMTWTATGQTELTVSIDAGTRVATITIPDVDWNGAETVTFRATDPGLLFDEDAATFTVTSVNDVPVVSDIPDQTIDEGSTFATISLDDYVDDIDHTDAEMTWTATGQTELTVSIDAGTRVATITIPDVDWNGAETVTFRATDPSADFAEDAATFTVNAVNDAPVVSDIPNQAINEGETFATISLDDYVDDVDNTDAEMTWTATGQVELTVSIDAGTRVATITTPSPTWNGSEIVTFRATDPSADFAEDAASFSVGAVNDPPVVTDIPDQTIAEGATFTTISLDDFVSDIDNADAEMTWTATGQTELTVSIDAGTRVVTITIPDVDWVGAETVTFRATDPGLAFDEDAATFTVTNVNDAPVVSDIPDQTIDEGSTFATIALDDFVDDIDNTDAEMTWTATGQTELTVSIDAGTRVATITIPDVDWNGTETITLRATDPGLLFGEDAATFTVNAVNDAPVVSDIPNQSISEGETFATINLDDYVDDVDNTDAEMTWTATGQVELTVSIDAGTRVATITIPSPTWNGTEIVTFRATDPGLLFGEDGVSLAVGAVNDAPVVSDIPDQTIAEGATFTTISLDDYVDDVDNVDADMTWTATGQTELTVDIDAGTRVATITIPDVDWNGAETVTFRATDPGLLFGEDAATFTVTAVNDAPVITDIPDQSINEGEAFATISLDDYVDDVDNLDADMVWTATGQVDLTVDIDAGTRVATITTPGPTWNGTEIVTFRVTDPGALFDEEAVTFAVGSVNDAPVVSDIPDQTIDEGSTFVAVSLDDYVDDIDNVDADMTWTATGQTELTVSIDAGTRVATITIPDVDWYGAETITFRATDPGALFGEDAATFTVNNINDAPVLSDIPDQTIMEQSTFAQINLDDYVTDTDNLPSEISWTASGINELTVDITNRVATITMPAPGWVGSETITFRATDPGSLFAEDAATFSVAANSVPVLQAIGTQTVVELGTLNFTVTASDPDGPTPVLSTSTPLPGSATFVDNGDGTGVFDWTTTPTDAGAYIVTFFATDSAYPGDFAFEDVLIIVGEAGNQAPIFTTPIGDSVVIEGGSISYSVAATDPEAGVITLSVNTTLNNYTFVDNGDGSGLFTYSPDYTDAGIDTVRFFATDNGTPQRSGSLVGQITTIDVNQPPVFDSVGAQAVAVGDTLTLTVSATDPTDSSGTARIFFAAQGMPANASFADNGNNTATFLFWPDATQTGVDTVTFLAIDGENSGLTTSLAVPITVVAVNQAPVLDPIGPQVVTEGNTLVVDVSASDADGPTLSLSASNLPTNASFVDNGDGTGVFTFSPSFVQSGLYSVTFKAYDGMVIDKEVVFIQVYEGGNQEPVFDSLPVGLNLVEGTSLEDIVIASDPEGEPVTLSITNPPANFAFVDSGNGVMSFTFNPDFTQAGIYDLTVVANDGALDAQTTLSIEVIDAGPQDPILQPLSDQTGTERTLIQFTVTATDADGEAPIMTSSTLPGTAAYSDLGDGNGVFQWTPTNFDAGTYPMTFYAEDASRPGVFDSLSIDVIVLDSNLAPNILAIAINDETDEGGVIQFSLTAWDADQTIPIIGARLDGTDSLAPNMEIVVTGDSTADFYFYPDYTQGDDNPTFYYIRFFAQDADDPTLITTLGNRTLQVFNVNAPPQLVLSAGNGPFQLSEGELLEFTVSAGDVDGTLSNVTAENLPANATFSGTQSNKLFSFSPDFTQSGTYTVRFIATDPLNAADTQEVVITVIDAANQPPSFVTTPSAIITAAPGSSAQAYAAATDPEALPLTMSATPTLTGATWIDNGDGSLTYTYVADAADLGNTYDVTIIATDQAGAADSVTFTFSVAVIMRGDADGNSTYSMNDVVFLVNYLYRGGAEPVPYESGDADLSGTINVADLAYMVNFLYNAGPRPPQ